MPLVRICLSELTFCRPIVNRNYLNFAGAYVVHGGCASGFIELRLILPRSLRSERLVLSGDIVSASSVIPSVRPSVRNHISVLICHHLYHEQSISSKVSS